VNVFILNDYIDDRIRALERRLKTLAVEGIYVKVVDCGRLTSTDRVLEELRELGLEKGDIAVIDVKMDPISYEDAGFDVFSAITENVGSIKVIFDSGYGVSECRSRFRQYCEQKGLDYPKDAAFSANDNEEIVDQVQRFARGFSVREARELLLSPFLCLFVAVDHTQNVESPNTNTFASADSNDFFGKLFAKLVEARQYLGAFADEQPLCDDKEFLEGLYSEEGSLGKLCGALAKENDTNRRFEAIRKLVDESSGECRAFLTEFERAAEDLSETEG